MAQELKVLLGRRKDNDGLYFIDLHAMPHAIVGGTTGSGKSTALKCIINQLIVNYSPKQCQLYIGDPKLVDFNIYKEKYVIGNELKEIRVPHVKYVANSVAEHDYMLDHLVRLMDWRFEWMKDNGLTDMKNTPLHPNIVVIVDEFGSLILDKVMGKRIMENLNKLTFKGRAAGITVMLATQHPTREIISSQIKANCPTRIALRVTTAINSMVILDTKGAEDLNGYGHMLVSSPYEKGLVEMQGFPKARAVTEEGYSFDAECMRYIMRAVKEEYNYKLKKEEEVVVV